MPESLSRRHPTRSSDPKKNHYSSRHVIRTSALQPLDTARFLAHRSTRQRHGRQDPPSALRQAARALLQHCRRARPVRGRGALRSREWLAGPNGAPCFPPAPTLCALEPRALTLQQHIARRATASRSRCSARTTRSPSRPGRATPTAARSRTSSWTRRARATGSVSARSPATPCGAC